jgi:hypothetical protein
VDAAVYDRRSSLDRIIDLLNDDSDAVRGNVAMAIATLGRRAKKATPTLENALELARQNMIFISERNFIYSGFPIFTGRSSATDICMALKDIGAPSPPDCFDGGMASLSMLCPRPSSNGHTAPFLS